VHAVIAALPLAAEGSSSNPILPSFNELIVGIVAFAALFFVLSKLAFPRASQTLEERTRNIEGKLEHAERARQQAEELLRRYQEKLASAEGEAQRIIDEARGNAERLRRELTAKAEAEAERMIARAREEIQAERDRAVRALRGEVGSLAVELASRVVGEVLDREAQLRLIDQYIDQLGDFAQAGALTSRRPGVQAGDAKPSTGGRGRREDGSGAAP
jgi:F-type H+-transporting ATPase subunit b